MLSWWPGCLYHASQLVQVCAVIYNADKHDVGVHDLAAEYLRNLTQLLDTSV